MNKKSISFVIIVWILIWIYYFWFKDDFPKCWKLESKMQEWYCIDESTIKYNSCRHAWWFMEKICNTIPSDAIDISWELYYINKYYIVRNNTLYYKWKKRELYIYNPSSLSYTQDWYLRDDKFLYQWISTLEIENYKHVYNNIFISWDELYLSNIIKRGNDYLDFYKIPNIKAKDFKILSDNIWYTQEYVIFLKSYEKNQYFSYLQLLKWKFHNIELTSVEWIFRYKDGFIVCHTWCINIQKNNEEYIKVQNYISWKNKNKELNEKDFRRYLIYKNYDQLDFLIYDWYTWWENDYWIYKRNTPIAIKNQNLLISSVYLNSDSWKPYYVNDSTQYFDAWYVSFPDGKAEKLILIKVSQLANPDIIDTLYFRSDGREIFLKSLSEISIPSQEFDYKKLENSFRYQWLKIEQKNNIIINYID